MVAHAEEEWRDVVGYERLYQVSSCGRVRSITRTVRFGNRLRVANGRVLKQVEDTHGYFIVVLSNGIHSRKNGKVHRLVAEAFIPNPDNLPAVDHINCDKHDNRPENLRWCTIAQNTRYARENGLFSPMSEERIRALVERSSRPVLRSDGVAYPGVRDAARAIGVTDSSIHHVLHNREYHHTCKGYTFTYVDEIA